MKNKVLKYGLWIVVIGWVAFSLYYIGQDYWNKYQIDVVQSSYQKGYTDSINELIVEAKKCQPVTAYSGEEKIELISKDCLSANNEVAGGETQ